MFVTYFSVDCIMHNQALLCSIELGSIKCNLEMAKIGILP